MIRRSGQRTKRAGIAGSFVFETEYSPYFAVHYRQEKISQLAGRFSQLIGA